MLLLERGPWRDSLPVRSMGVERRAPYPYGTKAVTHLLHSLHRGRFDLRLNRAGMYEVFVFPSLSSSSLRESAAAARLTAGCSRHHAIPRCGAGAIPISIPIASSATTTKSSPTWAACPYRLNSRCRNPCGRISRHQRTSLPPRRAATARGTVDSAIGRGSREIDHSSAAYSGNTARSMATASSAHAVAPRHQWNSSTSRPC